MDVKINGRVITAEWYSESGSPYQVCVDNEKWLGSGKDENLIIAAAYKRARIIEAERAEQFKRQMLDDSPITEDFED